MAGSADITNKVDVVMTYKRKAELSGDERVLTVSKNRLKGKLALGDQAIPLYYDPASKRISDKWEEFNRCYGWERDRNGFAKMTEKQAEQMEIPF